MQKLFGEVGSLDKRCYEMYHLSEDILMEHAANGMASYIKANFFKGSSILIVCGSGNNGADGMACARILHGDYAVTLLFAKPPKSKMAQLQAQRIEALHIPTCHKIIPCDVIVDAIVGTGFDGSLDENISSILDDMNQSNAFKIACDIPSGMRFRADVTLTMGALKKSLYLDSAKEFVGAIEVIDLGISRSLYEGDTNWFLLDFEDMKLPFRKEKDSHKGTYGHLAVAMGEKNGASIISAQAALRFGVGLVTLVGHEQKEIPATLMYANVLPKNTTALALGMGLGNAFSDKDLDAILDNNLPLIADADILISSYILQILERKNLVLTPHPKEFVALLKLTNIADITVDELQQNRFHYVERLSEKYPHAILLLKGANVIIAGEGSFFVNP
ncbi:MAG: NAD(P)H-hydrate epimerase, partial [Sulfurimonadaceae bacterium]|nr:NAD(P)H-hydrate epimerase [Sulfurimonadaceae bacterium]